MRRLLLVTILAAFSLVAFTGCGFVADGPFGWVYTDSTTPVATGTASSADKVGKACIHSYFGMITVGDASVEAAKKRAAITEIHSVNKENLSVVGTYTRQCTVVSGV